jgi:hypothetical protein
MLALMLALMLSMTAGVSAFAMEDEDSCATAALLQAGSSSQGILASIQALLESIYKQLTAKYTTDQTDNGKGASKLPAPATNAGRLTDEQLEALIEDIEASDDLTSAEKNELVDMLESDDGIDWDELSDNQKTVLQSLMRELMPQRQQGNTDGKGQMQLTDEQLEALIEDIEASDDLTSAEKNELVDMLESDDGIDWDELSDNQKTVLQSLMRELMPQQNRRGGNEDRSIGNRQPDGNGKSSNRGGVGAGGIKA